METVKGWHDVGAPTAACFICLGTTTVRHMMSGDGVPLDNIETLSRHIFFPSRKNADWFRNFLGGMSESVNRRLLSSRGRMRGKSRDMNDWGDKIRKRTKISTSSTETLAFPTVWLSLSRFLSWSRIIKVAGALYGYPDGTFACRPVI
ncbi:uncharacterized protein CLUP02_03969 [Colletotrichum lupini]|uniref:Uncharacterized protein n=1 Tax=Colletotrichum lupini TaxID=145971 RepID=A0A9Q8SJD5_9PEZI|nr:uncharacterized protein CLUP02_03969 [Colletotrichum lupini]UQC78492.1 hypothetical protein CLUP02_03969 [Colletotrichum lupini]